VTQESGQADILAAAVRIYRAWEAENMLDGDEPSTAGPSAVKDLVGAILALPQRNAPVAEKDTYGQPAR
jgi:hypothetical protein